MEPFAPLMDFAAWLNEPVKKKKENKMKEYHVTVRVEGEVDYRTRAETKEEAEKDAEQELENSLLTSEIFWALDLADVKGFAHKLE